MTVAATPSEIESQEARRAPNYWEEEVCRDWGQYILAGATVLTVGVGTFGWFTYAVTKSPSACVLASIITTVVAAEVFGFFRLRSLKPKRDFDANLNRFDAEKSALQEENAKLKEEIHAIDETNGRFEKNLSEQKKKIQVLLDDNKKLISKIDQLSESLSETKNNLAATEQLYQNLKSTFDRATITLALVNQSKKNLDSSESELSVEVKNISGELSSIDEENHEFDKENKALSQSITLFHKELEELKKKLTNIHKEKTELKALVDWLQTNNQKFLDGTSQISKAEQELNAQNDALEKKLTQLEALLSACKKAKDEDEKG